MSNPPCDPADQQNAVSTNGISYPGAAALQGHGTPAPVIMSKLPSRGGAITTLVLDVVLIVFIAPTVFFVMMIAGMAGTDGDVVKGDTTASGDVVTVIANGIFMVQADAHRDPSCSLIGADDKSYELEPYAGNKDVCLTENLPVDSYALQCNGTASGASIIVFNASPEIAAKVFAMSLMWGTVVGIVGLILLIVGIVLLVKMNGKHRRITQESMLSVVC